jgi:hypothetical protein
MGKLVLRRVFKPKRIEPDRPHSAGPTYICGVVAQSGGLAKLPGTWKSYTFPTVLFAKHGDTINVTDEHSDGVKLEPYRVNNMYGDMRHTYYIVGVARSPNGAYYLINDPELAPRNIV